MADKTRAVPELLTLVIMNKVGGGLFTNTAEEESLLVEDIKAVACCTRSFSFDTNGGAGTLHWGEYEWLSSASVFSKLEKQGRLPFCLWDGNTMVSPEELTSTGAVWRYSSLSRIIQVLSQRFLNFQLLEDISLD
ncbi:unnamed protein product [Brassica oleracea var. botrytis]|uniref:Uncharacterized protein n=2 Tax=Brassica TaxID=3705 RepID=A0A8S9NSA2_BRACR|nr:hypothetical protein F2Q69_00041011 [Brassica cretica]CAF1722744.1 unnamed protein product [Brassica napus]